MENIIVSFLCLFICLYSFSQKTILFDAGNPTGGGALSVSANSQSTIVNHCNSKFNKSNANFNSVSAALDTTGGGIGTVITNNWFDQNALPLAISTALSLNNSNGLSNNKLACIQVSNLVVPQQNISWKSNKTAFCC